MGTNIIAATGADAGFIAPKRLRILGLPEDYRGYFYDGLMMIDTQKWESYQTTEKVMAYLAENSRKINFEMNALNVILQGECSFLAPFHHYVPPTEYTQVDIPDDIIFLHYAEDKPWTKWCEYPLKRFCMRYMDISPWGGQMTNPIHYQEEKDMARFLQRHGKWQEALYHWWRYVARKICEKWLGMKNKTRLITFTFS